MTPEKLKSLVIDVENHIYQVNGRDIGENGHKLRLTFEDGIWSLVIEETKIYTTNTLGE